MFLYRSERNINRIDARKLDEERKEATFKTTNNEVIYKYSLFTNKEIIQMLMKSLIQE